MKKKILWVMFFLTFIAISLTFIQYNSMSKQSLERMIPASLEMRAEKSTLKPPPPTAEDIRKLRVQKQKINDDRELELRSAKREDIKLYSGIIVSIMSMLSTLFIAILNRKK